MRTLAKVMVTVISAPTPELVELRYRIKMALQDGVPPILTYTRFIKTIFHTNDVGRYDKLLELAQEAKIIRIVQGVAKRGKRRVRYVVLDTDAKICGNCYYYGTTQCPRLKGIIDIKRAAEIVKPWDDACEKFEPFLIVEDKGE